MVSAAILAGGRAARLGGCDKSALVIDGQSILERQLVELSQISDDLMLVGSRRPDERHEGVRLVTDRIPDQGPLGGLDAALAAARHPALLLLACDMPFVAAPFLRRLISLATEADVVVPRTKAGYHPLCAVYTAACREAVARRLAARRLAMMGLFDELRVRLVEPHEIAPFGDGDRLLANVNTPAVLEALQGHRP